MEKEIENLNAKIDKLEKEVSSFKNIYKVEIANIKVNYILTILILISFILIKLYNHDIFGLSIIEQFIIISLFLTLFFIKEQKIYIKYIIKKILLK